VQTFTRVDEGPLGRSTMSLCRPARLAGFVDHLWHSEGVISDRRERVLPNGFLELVLTFDQVHELAGAKGLSVIPRISFSGLRANPFVLVHPARCDTLGIILRPAGAYALLAQPLGHVTELTVDGRDVLGSRVDELFERCAAAHPIAARFALVVRWLEERLARAKAPDPAIAWIAAEIERGDSEVRVGALRKATGLSRERLVTRFREQVGVAPKLYARLVRFRGVLEQLRLAPASLTDVALDAGYYDQPHMNADFREFAGISPTEFLAARFPEGSGNTAREPA
jgi:methylphosphotriester-DNA--protein-cysteine methyltransferase